MYRQKYHAIRWPSTEKNPKKGNLSKACLLIFFSDWRLSFFSKRNGLEAVIRHFMALNNQLVGLHANSFLLFLFFFLAVVFSRQLWTSFSIIATEGLAIYVRDKISIHIKDFVPDLCLSKLAKTFRAPKTIPNAQRSSTEIKFVLCL